VCRILQESGWRVTRDDPDCGGGDGGEQGGGAAPVLGAEAGQDELALVQERSLHRDFQVRHPTFQDRDSGSVS